MPARQGSSRTLARSTPMTPTLEHLPGPSRKRNSWLTFTDSGYDRSGVGVSRSYMGCALVQGAQR